MASSQDQTTQSNKTNSPKAKLDAFHAAAGGTFEDFYIDDNRAVTPKTPNDTATTAKPIKPLKKSSAAKSSSASKSTTSSAAKSKTSATLDDSANPARSKRFTRSAARGDDTEPLLTGGAEEVEESGEQESPDAKAIRDAREQNSYINPAVPPPKDKLTAASYRRELDSGKVRGGELNTHWLEDNEFPYPHQHYQNSLNLPEEEFVKIRHCRDPVNSEAIEIPPLTVEQKNEDFAAMGIPLIPVTPTKANKATSAAASKKRKLEAQVVPSAKRAKVDSEDQLAADQQAEMEARIAEIRAEYIQGSASASGEKRKGSPVDELPAPKRGKLDAAGPVTPRRSGRVRKTQPAVDSGTSVPKSGDLGSAAPTTSPRQGKIVLKHSTKKPAPVTPTPAKGKSTGQDKQKVKDAIPSDYVGVPTHHGTSRNPPSTATRTAPWQCSFPECVSGMTWLEREGSGGYARKGVSQLFGRNKASTQEIFPDAWNWDCRKHYQTTKYANDTLAKTNKNAGNNVPDASSLYTLDKIDDQLLRFECWRPNATFRVQLTKRANDRLASYHAAAHRHGVPYAQANIPPSPFTLGQAKAPKPEEDFPVLELEAFAGLHAGAGKTYTDLHAVVAWNRGLVNALTTEYICPMEFLIAEAVQGETVVTTYLYQRFEAAKAGTTFDINNVYSVGEESDSSDPDDSDDGVDDGDSGNDGPGGNDGPSGNDSKVSNDNDSVGPKDTGSTGKGNEAAKGDGKKSAGSENASDVPDGSNNTGSTGKDTKAAQQDGKKSTVSDDASASSDSSKDTGATGNGNKTTSEKVKKSADLDGSDNEDAHSITDKGQEEADPEDAAGMLAIIDRFEACRRGNWPPGRDSRAPIHGATPPKPKA
ncbi:hypothetical protein AMS68_000143 [Peltaster fructicola]|uniref:Uncharacterized protein n=1 Tax=Peltaster fructicola TaxID=286661 RepID=A0A6H0XIT3_9PEZI|nr:hypothetical protein AMS68_000143 [Peltaster fructicola]